MGKTLTRPVIMFLMDYTTIRTCDPVAAPSQSTGFLHVRSCRVAIDGFYIVNALCVAIGFLLFVVYLRKAALSLQQMPVLT